MTPGNYSMHEAKLGKSTRDLIDKMEKNKEGMVKFAQKKRGFISSNEMNEREYNQIITEYLDEGGGNIIVLDEDENKKYSTKELILSYLLFDPESKFSKAWNFLYIFMCLVSSYIYLSALNFGSKILYFSSKNVHLNLE